jgi:hypothetical protein
VRVIPAPSVSRIMVDDWLSSVGFGSLPAMGPNRRAQERERAAARAAAEAKRAEAERIVAIWNARQAGGRALWFYPTIRCRDCCRRPVAHVLVPGLRPMRLARPSHARPAAGQSQGAGTPCLYR